MWSQVAALSPADFPRKDQLGLRSNRTATQEAAGGVVSLCLLQIAIHTMHKLYTWILLTRRHKPTLFLVNSPDRKTRYAFKQFKVAKHTMGIWTNYTTV